MASHGVTVNVAPGHSIALATSLDGCVFYVHASLPSPLDDAVDHATRVLEGVRVAYESPVVMKTRGGGAQLEDELVHVEIGSQLAGVDGHLGRSRKKALLLALHLDDKVSRRAGPIVELGRDRVEHAPAGETVFPLAHGQLEKGAKPCQASGLLEGWPNDGVDVAHPRFLEHLELKLLLRFEMGEEATLAHAGGRSERSDGQLLETDLAHQAEGFPDDGALGLFSLGHGA